MSSIEYSLISDLKIIGLELKKLREPISIDSLVQLTYKLQINAHLAILREPYLGKIIIGEKTVESRFTKNRVAPFKSVSNGDILFLKRSSGPICAITSVKKALYFGHLSSKDVEKIFNDYKDVLCVDSTFVESKINSKFASLFILGPVITIDPIRVLKIDKRPWIRLCQNLISKTEGNCDIGQLQLFPNDNIPKKVKRKHP